MITVVAALLVVGAVIFTLAIRTRDLPPPEPASPFRHLDERKAAIYENLRDLQFEYRLGKLSDQDYQQTKRDLQKELAGVMAEVDRIKQQLAQPAPVDGTGKKTRAAAVPAAAPAPKPSAAKGAVCPHCGAKFERTLKFCGECGKPMMVESA